MEKSAIVLPIHNYAELMNIIVLLEGIKPHTLLGGYIRRSLHEPQKIPQLIHELKHCLKTAPDETKLILGERLTSALNKYKV